MHFTEYQFSFRDSSDANKYLDESEDEAQRELRDEEAQQCQDIRPMPPRTVVRKFSPAVVSWGIAVNGQVIPAIICSSRETAEKAANTVSKKSWNWGKVVEVVRR